MVLAFIGIGLEDIRSIYIDSLLIEIDIICWIFLFDLDFDWNAIIFSEFFGRKTEEFSIDFSHPFFCIFRNIYIIFIERILKINFLSDRFLLINYLIFYLIIIIIEILLVLM